MAFTIKDLTQDTGKVAAEDFAKWLAGWLRGTQNGHAIASWLARNFGQLSSGVRRVLSIAFRIGIDPPEWLVKRVAKAFKLDQEVAMRILEEGLDQFIDTLCEVFGVSDLRSPEEAKQMIKNVSQEALDQKFAVWQRGRGWYEVHESQCAEILTGKGKIGFNGGKEEFQYIDGVKDRPLSWILDNIDVVTLPRCCERALPKEVRLQLSGDRVQTTNVKGAAKATSKQEKLELHPLAIVLNMMRLPPQGTTASQARFYENLVVQAESIPELEGICTSIRECATKPVWDVSSFVSVLTRAIGEDGQVGTTPPPAGVDPEEHRRIQISERAKNFAIAMELHVLAHESKTASAIAARVFEDIKNGLGTAFHLLALDVEKSPTAKQIVDSVTASTEKHEASANAKRLARLQKRADFFR